MATLPPSTDFTDAAVTEGQFKTAISQQRTFLADLLGTNGTNVTALATLGAMFGALLTRNANHTVVLGDRGKIIQCTGTIEIAFTTASTLGSAFSFIVVNAGSGTVTLNPAGSETINGDLTLDLSQGQSAVVYCDGSNFRTVGGSASSAGTNMQVFTSSGTFTVPAGVTKVKVTVVGGGGAGGNQTNPGNTGGGGGGGYSEKVVTGLSSGSGVSVTVGGAGGTSSFGAHCSATGGGNGGAFGVAGTGGAGSGGNFNVSGRDGQEGFSSFGGAGGSSILGNGAQYQPTANTNGKAGKLYGGGGSGCWRSSNGSNTGGTGTAGIVIVEY